MKGDFYNPSESERWWCEYKDLWKRMRKRMGVVKGSDVRRTICIGLGGGVS